MIKEIDSAKCNGCGMCVNFCPMDVLLLDDSGVASIAYPDDCMTCYNCELQCPMGAVKVDPFRKAIPPMITY